MPVTDIQLCDVAEVIPIVIKWLGVADPNYPEGSSVAAGSPYTLNQILEATFKSDYEICLIIANALDHPYRTMFATEETNSLVDGALIPAHLGNHSEVRIENYGDYDDDARLGRQRNFERIKMLQKMPEVYGHPTDLYAIHGQRIHFSDPDTRGKLDIPNVQYDNTFTDLQTPQVYFWGLVGMSIIKCALPETDYPHRQYWSQMAQVYLQDIQGGKLSLPKPEQLERIGT